MKEYGMSLSDRLVKEATDSKQSFCKLGAILVNETIPQKDRDTLSLAVNTPPNSPNGLTNAAIARVLREENYYISDSSVDRHRRGDCGCNKKAN
jgi:hypothetical protein